MDGSDQTNPKPTKPATYSEVAAMVMCSRPNPTVSTQPVRILDTDSGELLPASVEVTEDNVVYFKPIPEA